MLASSEQVRPGGGSLIALGANLPADGRDPAATVRHAAEEVGRRLGRAGSAWTLSRLFRTPAFPPGAGPDYVNAVMDLDSELDPEDMLKGLHRIEAEADRRRESRWASRTLDLDLLDVGGTIRPDPATFRHWLDLDAREQGARAPGELILPHPRLQDRGFVLVPLVDVAPDWRHPVLDRTAAELLAALPPAALEGIRPLG